MYSLGPAEWDFVRKQTNVDGFTALHSGAAKSKSASMITRLIAWGFDPNFEKKGWIKNPKKTVDYDANSPGGCTRRWL